MLMGDFSAYVNLTESLGRIGGNKKILLMLLDKFEKDKNYDELINAVESGDISKSANAAHAIKGMAANLSMPVLYDAATNYEKELKAGSHVPELFEAFKQARELTMQSLTAVRQELNS